MLLIVGRIGKPHGVRGEVTVEVRTDEPEARFAVGSVLIIDAAARSADRGAADTGAAPPIDGSKRVRIPDRLTVEATRWHQGRLLVIFEGVYDRDVAEALRGTMLGVDSAGMSAPSDPDEFHDHQLIGLRAVDPAGETLGEVVRIDHPPASDLLVLRRPGGRTVLVPFVKAIVPEIDLAGRRVVIDPPDGLLDL